MIFEELMRRHSELAPRIRRTLERRVRTWHVAEQEVIFRQVHKPGRLGLSDFTDMNDLAVTVSGVEFDHWFVLAPNSSGHVKFGSV